MSKQAYIRASLAIAALERFPHLIRESLLSDPKFRRDYGLTADAVLSFGNSGIAFQRSSLMDAVRRSFVARKKAPAVQDMAGTTWRAEFLKESDPPRIAFIQGKKRFHVVHLALLSPNRQIRLRVFRQDADRVGLPLLGRKKWEDLLKARPPDADELAVIQDDLNATPIGVQNAIRENISSRTVSLNVLVPRSQLYYERLAGKIEEGQTLENFVAASATPHMANLIRWNRSEGYRLCLLLAAQPSIGAALATLAIPVDQHAKTFDDLAAEGDPLSRAAAIEIGLDRVQTSPELKESLSRLIGAAVAAAPIAKVDPYKLLSALIVLCYGEIAYTRILASKPPFWRRLAAIAHAALIARSVAAADGDAADFIEWANKTRSQIFMLQCFADLRLEPRWVAELILPGQLKNELGGRIWKAAHTRSDFVTDAGWSALLLDETDSSLRTQLNLLQSILPGPLEGGLFSVLEIPAEYLAQIKSDFSQPAITAASFAALANAALLFRIPEEIADLAADAISRADYYLERADDQTPALPILLGLAIVSAVTRNRKLSDALFTVLRKYRRYYSTELDIDATFRIALTACASRSDLSEWCKCVGDCMTDLAFQEITRDEAERLHSHVTMLCHLVPELWATCGQAEAALQSVVSA